MTGNSEVPVPGGFGAAGAPNDQWHQVHHSLTKAYLRLSVSWACAPNLRKRMDELQMSIQANPSTKPFGFQYIVVLRECSQKESMLGTCYIYIYIIGGYCLGIAPLAGAPLIVLSVWFSS